MLCPFSFSPSWACVKEACVNRNMTMICVLCLSRGSSINLSKCLWAAEMSGLTSAKGQVSVGHVGTACLWWDTHTAYTVPVGTNGPMCSQPTSILSGLRMHTWWFGSALDELLNNAFEVDLCPTTTLHQMHTEDIEWLNTVIATFFSLLFGPYCSSFWVSCLCC